MTNIAGVPHASSEDDEYRGYYIPKGTTIMPNLWFMLRDPEDYPNPETFLPERFWALTAEESERTDPRNIVFGHDHPSRICPGRRFADISVWLVMANMVATFNISKARDALGNEITPPVLYEPGFTSEPVQFQCSIIPRSQQAADLIIGAT
ncbi:cytochrome P450 [Fomitopsis serialis]|uniref:cytochrome P450 n=1 Tax=Fomitopsis serialis TaxID=139415 RepID=UPI002008EB78|nr:cytochrome P450 [Neoantrodia serialis]KAH9912820.1 cytochrome P450 [Neoantrodia serialis]